MSEEMIPCPFCAEPIRAAAKKCRYCGEFLVAGVTQEQILAEHAQRLAAAPSPTPAAPSAATDTHPVTEVPLIVVTDEAGETTTEATSALTQLYERLATLPDSPEKEKVQQALQQLEEQASQGDTADESAVEGTLKNMAMLLPDVAEITINTIINPASGITTLIQKVAKRVAESQRQKSEAPAETTPDAAATPGEVSSQQVTEMLTQLQEQLPDSAEKEMVQAVLEQVESGEGGDAAADESESVIARVTEIAAVAVELTDGESGNGKTNGLVATLVEVAEKVITNTDSKP